MTGGSSGSGNGTVSYTVAANTSTSPRTGTMTIAGVTADGHAGRRVRLHCRADDAKRAGGWWIALGGGHHDERRAAGPASSNNTSWITVTSGSSGTGNGT